MKNLLLIIVVIVCRLNASAQSEMDTATIWPQNSSSVQNDKKVFTVVEQMPVFPGGQDAMDKFFADNIKYPRLASENGVSGRVFVTFVVNGEGKVTEPKILRGLGAGCDEESLRVVKLMPVWIPGKQNGKNVNVQYNLPVNFYMNQKGK